MIERGNMTDEEYIAALVAENKTSSSYLKKLERENAVLKEEKQLYIPFHQSRLHAPSEPPCRLTRATFTEVESDVDECYAYQNEQLSRTS
jgi:hypothetical protein